MQYIVSNHEEFEVSLIIEKYNYKNDDTKNIFVYFLKIYEFYLMKYIL